MARKKRKFKVAIDHPASQASKKRKLSPVVERAAKQSSHAESSLPTHGKENQKLGITTKSTKDFTVNYHDENTHPIPSTNKVLPLGWKPFRTPNRLPLAVKSAHGNIPVCRLQAQPSIDYARAKNDHIEAKSPKALSGWQLVEYYPDTAIDEVQNPGDGSLTLLTATKESHTLPKELITYPEHAPGLQGELGLLASDKAELDQQLSQLHTDSDNHALVRKEFKGSTSGPGISTTTIVEQVSHKWSQLWTRIIQGSEQKGGRDAVTQTQIFPADDNLVDEQCTDYSLDIALQNAIFADSLTYQELAISHLQVEVSQAKALLHANQVEEDTKITHLETLARELDQQRDIHASVLETQAEYKSKIACLEAQVKELEQQRDMHAPIVRKGADIGLRFLENARTTVFKTKHKQIYKAIVNEGNKAAHRGNAEFHSAIFKAGLVPKRHLPIATAVYKELYESGPSQFPHYPPVYLRMVNCRATLKALDLKKIPQGSILSFHMQNHNRLESQILESGRILAAKGQALNGGQIEGLITQLELLNEQIVDAHRQQRGYKEPPLQFGDPRTVFPPFVGVGTTT